MTPFDKFREQVRIAHETGTFVVLTADEGQAIVDYVLPTTGTLAAEMTAILNTPGRVAFVGEAPGTDDDEVSR